MARAVADNYDKYDGFVITHGTDTLAYTAAALHQMLRHLSKPVIITGAQLPLEAEGSDGPRNLKTPFSWPARASPACSCVSRAVIDGGRAKKMHTESFAAYAA